MNIEDQVEINLSEDIIKETLLSSSIPELKENKDEVEIMIDSLVEFLLIPANKQFYQIFIEVFSRNSTKASAKSN